MNNLGGCLNKVWVKFGFKFMDYFLGYFLGYFMGYFIGYFKRSNKVNFFLV